MDLPFGVARVDAAGEPTGFVTEFAVRGLSRDGHRALAAAGVPWASGERQYARLARSPCSTREAAPNPICMIFRRLPRNFGMNGFGWGRSSSTSTT